MDLEYDFKIGAEGISFALPATRQRDPRITEEGDRGQRIEEFIMRCWERAINESFPDPQELARLMSDGGGQKLVADRATAHLSMLLTEFPSDLDRRGGSERRGSGRDGPERRRLGRPESH